MRFSITVSITLLFTVFGFSGTWVYANEFPGQLQDISDTITMTDAGNRIISRSLPMDYSGDASRSGAFIKVYGGTDYANCESMDLTADGGYILTGTTQGELLLMKLDANGNKIWVRTFVYDTSDDIVFMSGRHVRQVSDGGYIVVGNVGVQGQINYWELGVVLKITPAGWLSWAKRSDISGYFHSVEPASGGYIITGQDSTRQYLIKINYDGDVIFKRIINTIPGAGADSILNSVQQCIDYGYIACGHSQESMYSNPTQCLQKFDAFGNVNWIQFVKHFQTIWSELNSVRQTSDAGYIAAGLNYSSSGTPKASFVKFNSDGTKMWARDVSGVIDDTACMNNVEETVSGDIIAVGYTGDTSSRAGYFLKFSSTGALIAARIFDGTANDSLTSIKETADSGYIIAGKTGNSGASDGDILLIKTSSSGLVPGCSFLEACYPASTEPFTEIEPITYESFEDNSNLDSIDITITERNLGITTLCLEPTATPTATFTPIPTATAVGCSILSI